MKAQICLSCLKTKTLLLIIQWHTGIVMPVLPDISAAQHSGICILHVQSTARDKTVGARMKGKARNSERRKREDYCLLPTSPSFLHHSFENDITSPPKEVLVLFFSPPAFILCFSSSFHRPCFLLSDFPPLWNNLLCSMWTNTWLIGYRPTCSWIICLCVSGCYKTTSWRDFPMMLRGTCPTCCPCESLSLSHTHTHTLNHATLPHPTGNKTSPAGHPRTSALTAVQV